MLIATIETIPNKTYTVLGTVVGNIVQTKHIGKDVMAGLKSLVGGEVGNYTELLAEARTIATKRMVDEANKLGADAVVGMRYITCDVMSGASEVTAYGTAVKFN